VRVPRSWKLKFKERSIDISYVCRSALFQALQQSEPVLRAGAKLHSKQRAAALFNALNPRIVATFTDEIRHELTRIPAKLPYFRSVLSQSCTPQELSVLGEFLDQTEYAEEILQEVFI